MEPFSQLREALASCALNGVPSSPASLLFEYLPIDLQEEILPLFVSRFAQLELARTIALDKTQVTIKATIS